MGRKTQEKKLKCEQFIAKYKESLDKGKRRHAYCPKFNIIEKFPEKYNNKLIRDISEFSLKTKSSCPRKQILELVKFLFCKYKSPKILEQAWYSIIDAQVPTIHMIDGKHYDFKDWYICVSTGGSLYKEYAKELLTKKELYIFLTCPHDLTISQALYYSVSKSITQNDGIALRIARSKISEKPFTNFWRNCARYFSVNVVNDINMISDIVDYLQHKKTEDIKYELYGSGISLNVLQKKMHTWHADLRRIKNIGNSKWDGHPINDQSFTSKIDGKDVIWKFTQIKTSKGLAAEGNAMRHCVFGYNQSCISGDISIWSLTLQEYEFAEFKRKITIELRNNGRIAQCRGLANRKCRPDEAHIIKLWARENNLDFSNYY